MTRATVSEGGGARPGRRDDAWGLAGLAAAGPGVDVDYLKQRYRAALADAFADAMAGLDDDQRVALRYFYVDGVNLDQLGALLGVSRATAHRRLVKARAALAAATTAQLRARIPAADCELDSIRRLVQSRFELSHLSQIMRASAR